MLRVLLRHCTASLCSTQSCGVPHGWDKLRAIELVRLLSRLSLSQPCPSTGEGHGRAGEGTRERNASLSFQRRPCERDLLLAPWGTVHQLQQLPPPPPPPPPPLPSRGAGTMSRMTPFPLLCGCILVCFLFRRTRPAVLRERQRASLGRRARKGSWQPETLLSLAPALRSSYPSREACTAAPGTRTLPHRLANTARHVTHAAAAA
eukprot:357476-Chlamydomonas_euryale.AAC.4